MSTIARLPIGRQIKLRRNTLKLSLNDVCSIATVNKSSLSRVEAGSDPSLSTLEQLCAPLSCSFVTNEEGTRLVPR